MLDGAGRYLTFQRQHFDNLPLAVVDTYQDTQEAQSSLLNRPVRQRDDDLDIGKISFLGRNATDLLAACLWRQNNDKRRRTHDSLSCLEKEMRGGGKGRNHPLRPRRDMYSDRTHDHLFPTGPSIFLFLFPPPSIPYLQPTSLETLLTNTSSLHTLLPHQHQRFLIPSPTTTYHSKPHHLSSPPPCSPDTYNSIATPSPFTLEAAPPSSALLSTSQSIHSMMNNNLISEERTSCQKARV